MSVNFNPDGEFHLGGPANFGKTFTPFATADNLHFGSLADDPTGVRDCEECHGHGPASATCKSCGIRQQLRDAWWNSSPGPARLGLPTPPRQRYLDDEEA